MHSEKKDVLTVGNAIVDIIYKVDEQVLYKNELVKGGMALVTADKANSICKGLTGAVEVSGGSAANTAVGISKLGASVKFIGKVSHDSLGKVFRKSIVEAGVDFATKDSSTEATTANCVVLVTNDGERTMSTYLGSCVELGANDIDADSVINSNITYIEGYLWDSPGGKAAIRKVFNLNASSERLSSFSLSDSFCVDRHKKDFIEITSKHVDILFANEQEIQSLFEVSNFNQALSCAQNNCGIVIVTRGAKGSVIVTPDEMHLIQPPKVSKVIDTTGAGDMYAAGFLYGYSKGYDIPRCGRLGALMSGEIISHLGARPEINLTQFRADSLRNT